MMQLHAQHWHVALTYPGYQDGYEDQPFEDLDSAMDYANQTRDTFREDGHRVTEVDRPDDDVAGVIQRYQATEEKDTTVAIVEVRPCYRGMPRPDPPGRRDHRAEWRLTCKRSPRPGVHVRVRLDRELSELSCCMDQLQELWNDPEALN